MTPKAYLRSFPAIGSTLHSVLLSDPALLLGANNPTAPGLNIRVAMLPGSAQRVLQALHALQTTVARFGGEVYVLASATESHDQSDLEAVGQELFPQRFRYLNRPGLSDGALKNLALDDTDKGWLLFLDPRIELAWNPLVHIEEELACSGVHFLNLPRTAADGAFSSVDHLAVEYVNGAVQLVAEGIARGTASRTNGEGLAYCTLLDSTSLLANADTLRRNGGFSETLSDGAEDIELSARLFRRGYKIAVSGAVAIHEPHDLARERRTQTVTLANPIENLSSFLGPYPIEDLRATGQRPIERHPLVGGAHRPRIALVIDVDYWAFGNIARQLCRYLSDRFEFRVIPASVVSQVVQILILAEDCDIIHFFWRDKLRSIGSPCFREYAESLGFRYSDFEKRFLITKVITTSVYDHLFLDVDELPKRRDLYNARISGYSVASEKLNSLYSGLDGYPAPSALTEDGVDLTLFKPARLERFRTISERELVVGWAGNSAWAARREDFKGVHTILNPALEDLAREGYRIRPCFADRQIRYIAHTEMPQYYSKVDLYICTSKIEGTPNPVLEAMACGVPIVSTDVGIVPQAFGELQKQFIMQERSKEALKDLIKELVDNPLLFSRLSSENLESVKSWDWSIKAEKFADFFKQMYARSRPTSGDDRPD